MKAEKTEEFISLLVENFHEILGFRPSRNLAWSLYKVGFVSNIQFLVNEVDPQNLHDVRLPLWGIGTWRLEFRKPDRGWQKKGTSQLIGVVRNVPFIRLTPSKRYRRILLARFHGVAEPTYQKEPAPETEGNLMKKLMNMVEEQAT